MSFWEKSEGNDTQLFTGIYRGKLSSQSQMSFIFSKLFWSQIIISSKTIPQLLIFHSILSSAYISEYFISIGKIGVGKTNNVGSTEQILLFKQLFSFLQNIAQQSKLTGLIQY